MKKSGGRDRENGVGIRERDRERGGKGKTARDTERLCKMGEGVSGVVWGA